VGTSGKLAVSGPGTLFVLACFTLTLAVYRWRGGRELACGCFAEFDEKTPTSIVLARNLLLLGAGLPLLWEQNLPLANGSEEWVWATITVAGLVLTWSMLHRLADAIMLVRSERRYWEE